MSFKAPSDRYLKRLAAKRLADQEPSEAELMSQRRNKKAHRRLRNRVAAAKSRQKKKDQFTQLLDANRALQEKNADFKAENAAFKTKNAAFKAENAGLKAEIANLKAEIAGLKAEIAFQPGQVQPVNAPVVRALPDGNERFSDPSAMQLGTSPLSFNFPLAADDTLPMDAMDAMDANEIARFKAAEADLFKGLEVDATFTGTRTSWDMFRAPATALGSPLALSVPDPISGRTGAASLGDELISPKQFDYLARR